MTASAVQDSERAFVIVVWGRPQMAQPLGSWSENVASWTRNRAFPVYVIRYEDLLARPIEEVSGALSTIGRGHTVEDVARAVAACSFERLRVAEQADGFREHMSKSNRFFRRGTVGTYRDDLTEQQVAAVVAAHGPMMRRFGYLDDEGRLLV